METPVQHRQVLQQQARVERLTTAARVLALKAAHKAYQAAVAEWRRGGHLVVERVVVALRATATPLGKAMLGAVLQSVLYHTSRGPLTLGYLEDTTKAAGNRLRLSVAQVKRLRSVFDDYAVGAFGKVSGQVERKLSAAMESIVNNLSVRAGVQRLESAFKSAGIHPRNSFTLEGLFRTNVQMANSAGQWIGNQDPDIQDALWGYRYVTVGDDRVRPEHAALDGTVAPKEDPIWRRIWPPNGFACRCQVVEVWEPEETVKPRDGGGPDRGFDFNSGEVFKEVENILAGRPETIKPRPAQPPRRRRVQKTEAPATEETPPQSPPTPAAAVLPKSRVTPAHILTEVKKKVDSVQNIEGLREDLKARAKVANSRIMSSKGDPTPLIKERDQLWREVDELDKVYDKQLTTLKQEIHGMLFVDEEDRLGTKRIRKRLTGVDAKTEAGIDDAINWFGNVVSKKAVKVDAGINIKFESGRGSFKRAVTEPSHTVFCRNGSVASHEMGHWLETDESVRKRALAWLDSRTKGETPIKLNSLPGGGRHKDHEITTPDKFADPYVGRRYSWGDTEVVSMGMQYMYDDPVRFFRTDPDHFKFILEVLRGAGGTL